MSLDPAISPLAKRERYMSLAELPVVSDAAYIFDFDGVISSGYEDSIYRLPPTQSEKELISNAANYFGIRCNNLEQRYQRHLVYQAAAWKLGLPIDVGPGFEKALAACSLAPFFVLTARSGWFAVERLRHFLTSKKLLPTEVYNVGRVTKDKQVELTCREFDGAKVYFIDDSEPHLRSIPKASFPGLTLVLVEQHYEPDQERLRIQFENTVRIALSR